MHDEARLAYHDDVSTRKKISYSANHKKGGSAVVKLGNKQDTRKEILNKNGDIYTYPSTDNLMSYSDFLSLNGDLKAEFCNIMMERYDISLRYISRYLFNKGDDGLRAMLEKWKLLKLVDTRKKRSDSPKNIDRFKVEVSDWKNQSRIAREIDKQQSELRKNCIPKLLKYDQFKKLPPDDQADYMNRLIKYYQIPQHAIAMDLFEIRPSSLSNHCSRVGIVGKLQHLPRATVMNLELMHETEKRFKRDISAWKDFSESEEEEPIKVEETKVIDITPMLESKQETFDPDKRAHEILAEIAEVPADTPMANITNKLVFGVEPNPVTPDEVEEKCGLPVTPLEFSAGWHKEEPAPAAEPDPMAYHEMRFSMNSIYEGANMNDFLNELYGITAFFKRCKHFKVSIELSEV